jgi:hypothetical protein
MNMRTTERPPEPIWTATWPTATGAQIVQTFNFAAYELLLWERMVRVGR